MKECQIVLGIPNLSKMKKYKEILKLLNLKNNHIIHTHLNDKLISPKILQLIKRYKNLNKNKNMKIWPILLSVEIIV